MTTQLDSPVLVLDLRDASAEAGELAVYELLRDRRHRGGQRILAVDRTASLVDHDPAYQAIWASRLVDQVLCVAVGPPADRAGGLAIRASPVLNHQTAATLWVGDTEGVSWPAGAGEAPGSLGAPHYESGLHTLLDLLRLPAVYERVIELADSLPNRVASPGHLVVAGQIGPADLAEAKREAVAAITGSGAGAPAVLAGDDYAAILGLLGTSGPLPGDLSRMRAGSPIATAREDALRACERADRGVTGLAGRFGPRLADRSTEVWGEVTAAGQALDRFRTTLTGLFERIDGRAGVDAARRDTLERAGVITAEVPDTGRAAITDRLRDQLADALDRGYSLAELAVWLRGLADRAAPTGSVARVGELREACPDPLIGRLRTPPAFPWQHDQPWALGVAMAGGLLAAFGPWGVLTGPLLVLAWVAGVGLAAARRPRPARAGRATRVQQAILWHLVAGGVGCVVGSAMAAQVAVPLAVGLPLAAVAAGAMGVAMRMWWSRAVSAWRVALGLRRSRDAAGELSRMLCAVAVDEWVLSEPRRFLADAALTTAGALGAAAVVLTGAVPPGPDGAAPGTRTAAGLELRRLVSGDLLLVMREAMRNYWERLRAGVLEDVRPGLRERLTGLLADYTRHVELYGIDRPFGDPPSTRSALVNALWQESPAIRGVLRDLVSDRRMIQLCGPEDLPLLDQTADRFRLIRFAPRAAQAVFGPDSQAAEMTWTASGHVAGLLRLVPLRTGAVELNWETTVGERDAL